MGIFSPIIDNLDETNDLFVYLSQILNKIGQPAVFYGFDLSSEKGYDQIAEKYANFELEDDLDDEERELVEEVQEYFFVLSDDDI